MTTTTATEQAALLVLKQLVADVEAGVVGIVAQASADGPEGCSLIVRWAAIDKVVERAPAPSEPPKAEVPRACPGCGVALSEATVLTFDDGCIGCRKCGREWRPD